MSTTQPTLYQLLADRIDWERPELAPLAARLQTGDVEGAVLGFIRHLRERETPYLGYTRAYITHLRQSVPAEQQAAAVTRWEMALERDLLMPYHGNAFGALGAETVFLAASPEFCRRSGERVIEYRERWGEGFFGVVHSIVDVLRFFFPLEECSDADLVPVFCWLLAKHDVEWKDARRWSENTLGTSGHNWWAHTFLGFFMLGLFFPELKGMGQFRAFGKDYLDRELAILFENDGWTKEGSHGYHGFASHSLMQLAHVAELNGIVISEVSKARLRAIADASWKLIAPDGDYPVFGDDVRVSRYQGFHGQDRPEAHPCNVLRRYAARFSVPEAKYVAEALDPNWQPPYGAILPDEGQDMIEFYSRVPSRSPAMPDTVLPDSGFYVMRQNWTPQADYAAIIAGTFGPRVSSHKHADIFSFELYSRGRRILVDNWYGPPLEERDNDDVRMWRVGTAAHNAATVDGQDQVPVVQEFLYGATIVPTVDDWRSDAKYTYFSGVHEGYLNIKEPVSAVRRKLFYLRGDYWIMLDRFTAITQAEHDYQLHFHLNVPSTLMDDGRLITKGDGGNLLIMPVPGANGTANIEPNPYPVNGYENPDHLCYTRHQAGHDLFVTILVPFNNATAPEVSAELVDVECDGRIISPWEGTGLRINFNGREDFYFDQHLQWNLPWRAGGYAGDGRLFHSRCHK
ncbi:MAG: heparinase II/III family protein [Armatimonadota bacterium]